MEKVYLIMVNILTAVLNESCSFCMDTGIIYIVHKK